MTTIPPDPAAAAAPAAGFDDASFDDLVTALGRWSEALPEWPPARRVRAEWEQVAPRLERTRRELSRVLVVGVLGGTGTGKSTLVNALAGREVSPAGDVARPTTVAPVVVVAPDVDCSWLSLDGVGARVVTSDAPAVANIVLVDCPDPDTQGGEASAAASARADDGRHNRDLLERVLPACDVLLLVATVQKYRSWIVAREVAAFAPGRPMLFVQTHASRDPDIRDDWRRELERQGIEAPRIHRVDGVDAARRAAAGLDPEPGFAALLRDIDDELAGRAARRVRRTGGVDLAGWFLRQALAILAPTREPVAALAAGVDTERRRLESLMAKAVGEKLRAGRPAWQRVVQDELVERWQGGAFGMFLHLLAGLGALWPRIRAGGFVGRVLAGQGGAAATAGDADWRSIEEVGLSEADVEQSRSILSGVAARAAIGEPMVRRTILDDATVRESVGTLLDRTGRWLLAGLDRVVVDRRGRTESWPVRWIFEAAFTGMIVAVLGRAAWDFFHGHLWLGRPAAGLGFLQEALVWIVLWGLVLRSILFRRVRSGLDREMSAVVGRLPGARLVDPFIDDFASAAARAGAHLAEGDALASRHAALAAGVEAGRSSLGRLTGPTP